MWIATAVGGQAGARALEPVPRGWWAWDGMGPGVMDGVVIYYHANRASLTEHQGFEHQPSDQQPS